MPIIHLEKLIPSISYSSSTSDSQTRTIDEGKCAPSTDATLINEISHPHSIPEPEPESKRCPLKGLMCIFGAFMGLFSTFGQINAFGTFQAWYAVHQLSDSSSSAISWIGSAQLCSFFMSGWVIGRLYDSFGPRVLMIIGTVVNVVALMMTSISRSYAEFLITQGVFFGLGSALVFYPAIGSVSTHYSKYKATAIGVALAGTSIGGITFPIITHALLTTIGFEKTLRISGLICLVTCTLATMCVSSNREHSVANRGPWLNARGIFDTKFLMLTSACMIVAFGLFTPYIYIVEYATAARLPSVSLYVLSVMNGGGAIGRVVPAIISDVYGRFNLLLTSAFLAGVSCLALWLPSALHDPMSSSSAADAATVIAFGAVYGIASGAFISLVNPCIFQITERGQEGTRMGALNTLVAIPTLLGGPIGGALLAAGHGSGFKYMSAFSGSCLVLGSLVVMLVRMRVSGGVLLIKV